MISCSINNQFILCDSGCAAALVKPCGFKFLVCAVKIVDVLLAAYAGNVVNARPDTVATPLPQNVFFPRGWNLCNRPVLGKHQRILRERRGVAPRKLFFQNASTV